VAEGSHDAVKDYQHVTVICKGFCRYFKDAAKEEMSCGTFEFLAAHLTAGELRSLILLDGHLQQSRPPDFTHDAEIRELICERCGFLIDGCDFRKDRSGPPCGGYVIVERLLP
jgi:hypothetical protein